MPNRSSLPVKKPPARYKNAVGGAVRRLRSERGWTQDDFAAKLQVLGWSRCTRSWLSRIEARLVAVRDYELAYFCKVFQVPLQALYPSLDPRKVDPNFDRARSREA
jgi:transcriptional regulator with XRE-family HTH domain